MPFKLYIYLGAFVTYCDPILVVFTLHLFLCYNFADLSLTLQSKVYGQHLVIGPVLKHLKAHAKKNPSKALVLSFHGWTGTGKNYVSKLAVHSTFRMGMKSKFVHLISATKEFPHEEFLTEYKVLLLLYTELQIRRVFLFLKCLFLD